MLTLILFDCYYSNDRLHKYMTVAAKHVYIFHIKRGHIFIENPGLSIPRSARATQWPPTNFLPIMVVDWRRYGDRVHRRHSRTTSVATDT